ncbi:Putative KHG/KDPG aldolase [uncultured Eubacterium sp.]|nr:Putative KHG/KDPG aldolase [uncultured Eubacterium sp.]
MKNELRESGVIPVVKISEIEKAERLAESLQKGGINCAEITFRAERAEIAISKILNRFPKMIVGAGTVLSVSGAKKAIEAGARFIVSPGFDEEIVQYSLEKGVLVIPGCITPTEIQKAIKYGLDIVKFFPAEQFGGLKSIKALAAPFPNVSFVPTGGITLDNLKEYMSEQSVLAVGGTFMVREELIQTSQWDRISQLSEKSVEIIKKFR